MATSDLLPDVERFLARYDMAESTFGRGAVNDWKFINSLRRGRRIWPETEARVRAFMSTHAEAVTRDVSRIDCHNSPETKEARA